MTHWGTSRVILACGHIRWYRNNMAPPNGADVWCDPCKRAYTVVRRFTQLPR